MAVDAVGFTGTSEDMLEVQDSVLVCEERRGTKEAVLGCLVWWGYKQISLLGFQR